MVADGVPAADDAAREQRASNADTAAPEASADRVRGRPFRPGQSGNPAGRPRGSRNRVTRFCEQLLGDDAQEIIRAAISGAKAGKAVALRLCVERLVPVRSSRDRVVEISVPTVRKAADLVEAAAAVIDEAARGEMTLAEAREFMHLLDVERRAIETQDLAVRIDMLTAQAAERGGLQQSDDALDRRAAAAPLDIDEGLAERVRRLAMAQLRARAAERPSEEEREA
jgi:hypothetical protein